MQFNTLHLIYFSPTHTSQAIGRAIAQGTGCASIIETDLTYGVLEKPLLIEEALTVIVMPVYGGRVAETAMERLENVKGCGTPLLPVVVYGNRDYEDALIELKDWGMANGFQVVAGAAFVGEHSFSRPGRPVAAGRPDSADLQIAATLGQQAAERLREVDSCLDMPDLSVKGNHPYKVKANKTPQAPVFIRERCVRCGDCAAHCPVGAIGIAEEVTSNAELCIKCCACVKGCTQEACVFDTPYTDMLFKNFSVRREPELFL